MAAPTFSSFPTRPVLTRVPESQPVLRPRPRRRDRQALEQESPEAPTVPSPGTYKDVVFDRSRFGAFTIDAPTYRRQTCNVVGLPSLFKIEHGKEVRGIEVGSRDESTASRTRLPHEPSPAKIRRLAPEAVEFDRHASFIGFTPREITNSDDFENEFSDLPRSDALRRVRVVAIEKTLQEVPSDIDTWLRYATLHLPTTTGDPLDGPFDKATADVALAIIERAIALNIDTRLHLAYIRIARHICTPLQLSVRWALVLSTFPLEVSVWFAYLDWCETDGFGTFNDVEDIVSIYGRFIDMLRATLLREASRSTESSLVRLFLRAAKFLKNTGYDERSFALFQALIEITFFKPPQHICCRATQSWWTDLLDDFEAFWDSQSPRFGDLGSMGWRHGIRSPHTSKPTLAESDDWYTQEISQLDDPFSFVLFDDLCPLLIPIVSPEGRLEVIHALLTILDVVIIPPDHELDADPFLFTNCTVNWPGPKREYSWIHTPANTRLHDLSMRYWAFDIDTLYADPADWFSFAKSETPNPRRAKRCITQLQPFIPDPRYSMITLAIDRTSKSAKALLSQDRNNLNMWYAFAVLEIGRGKYDSARSVFANALSFAKTQRSVPGEDELDLLAGWVQMESDIGEKTRAVDLLMVDYERADFMLRIAPTFEPHKPTPTQLLRCQHLSHPRLAFFYTSLLKTDQIPATDELHLQFVCRQLWRDRKLALLSPTVDTALEAFPHNTLFQTLRLRLAERQSRQAAERMIQKTIPLSIIHQLWGIGEMARLAGSQLWKSDGSGAQRLRHVFETALRSSQGRHCLSVWRLYIDFESMMGDQIVKRLCYRAAATMGSCKDLYLLPFSPSLRSHFTPQEHRDWLLLMVERGIRIRVPFEHLLQVEEDHLPSDEELEDDELAFLREAQKLKPYE